MLYTLKGEQRNTGRTHFKKGCTPWNKGKTEVYSEETLTRMGDASRGRPSPMLGKHHSTETKISIGKKVSALMLGNTYTKDKPWSETRRKAQEAHKGKPYGGKRSPVIKNGKKYSPFWHELRKLIYKRDNWTCQECGVKCHNSKKAKIQCHHMDYDTKNNNPSNLITLCASCHAKTNWKRQDWIKHFSTIQKWRVRA